MPRRTPRFLRLAASLLVPCLLLNLPALAPAAEALFWPVTGVLRDCPALMDTALYANGAAGNVIIIQADVPGDVAGAVLSTPPPLPATARGKRAATPEKRTATDGTAIGGTARRNTVILQRGTVDGFVDGGWSDMGAAQDNILLVSGGTVRKMARGGGSNGGPADGNVLHMTAGSVEGSAFGGSSLRDRASGNVLNFSGGDVRDAVVGGSSSFGQALGNTVRMAGGRVASVLGGSSGHGNALGNSVFVMGGVVESDIVGGETVSGELATQNTVTIGREARLSPSVAIFGGLKNSGTPHSITADSTASGDQRKGNVLYLQGWTGHVRGVHNFQYWNIALPENIQAGDTVLTVDEGVNLHDAVLRLTGTLPASLKVGDKVTLLRAPTLHTVMLQLPSGTLEISPKTPHADVQNVGSDNAGKHMAEWTLSLDNEDAPTAVVLTLTRLATRPPHN